MEENPIIGRCSRLTSLGAIAAGYGLLGLSFLVGFEVVARKLFAFSLQGVDEIGGYVLAVTVTFGLSHTLLQRAHTRIDIFLGWLPARLQPFFNFLAFLSLAGFAVFATWRGAATLSESIAYRSVANTPLQTPLWIPQSIWVAGLFIFAALSAAMAAHAAYLLWRCPQAILSQYGVRTIQVEVEEEIGDAAAAADDDQGRAGAGR